MRTVDVSNGRRLLQVRQEIALLSAEARGLENGSLAILRRDGEATPVSLAQELRISRQGANNYLSALLACGLATREAITVPGHGGRRFTYRPVDPSAQGTKEAK